MPMRTNLVASKSDWLTLLTEKADQRNVAVVRPQTSDYDFLLAEKSNRTPDSFLGKLTEAIPPSTTADDAFALGVVRPSDADHRRALAKRGGYRGFFFDIHGPLVLLQTHSHLEFYFVILDVYSDDGYDPAEDYTIVLPGKVLKAQAKKQGPYLRIGVRGPGEYAAPADEYVDAWELLFER